MEQLVATELDGRLLLSGASGLGHLVFQKGLKWRLSMEMDGEDEDGMLDAMEMAQ